MGDETHVLTVFNDSSCFLSKRTPQGLLASPQVLCFERTPIATHTPQIKKLKLTPSSPHHIRFEGDEDVIEMYKNNF